MRPKRENINERMIDQKELKSKDYDKPDEIIKEAPLNIRNEKYLELYDSLSQKQKYLVEFYLRGYSRGEAYYLAGYSKKNKTEKKFVEYGSVTEVFKNKIIKEAILIGGKDLIAQHGVTKYYVVNELLELIDESKNDEKMDKSTILKSLEMLSKLGGFYQDVTNNFVADFSNISVDIVPPPTNQIEEKDNTIDIDAIINDDDESTNDKKNNDENK